ncbi:unknown [Sinorhizobium phage PBC5]|uniref:virion structural protein n=1 Tax=Sinorhizobium phage PBC5 TaxID=179237 RepID=UPI000009AFE9|nr:virion structural protein [Sinorhizobium phage PBC5]AAL49596.1 unknown [Sinorhizobium phage PBC5]
MAHMVDIDDFLPQVLLYAPNCADQVAYRFLREAAREFCQRTNCWRESDEVTISTPECEGIGTTSDAEIQLIQRAELDGVPLTPRTVAWLDENRPGWETSTEITVARYITQIQPNTVTVVPRAEGTLTMRLVLKPSLSARTLPGFLLDQWGTEIGKGAAARVLLLPESQNPDLGAGLLQEFKDCLGTEAIRTTKGQQGARLRTRGSYF